MSPLASSTLIVALAVVPLAATVVSADDRDLPRIGYLLLSPLADTPSPERNGFLEGLREHGYEDGKNIIIEYRSADGDPEKLPFLAEELVELKVRAIVGLGSPVIRAAREASSTVPIVMFFGADPVALGFVQSLARPGTNVTGMTHMPTDLGPKRLQLLKEALPGVMRVAVVWDSSNPGAVPEWKAIAAAARRLQIKVRSISLSDVEDPLARIAAARPDAILTIIDPRVAAYRQVLPRFALERRIPTMFDWRAFSEEGGLMSYAPDFPDMARRAAAFVVKILDGVDPATLPVEQPTEIQFIINLKTAGALGIKIPDDILLRADKVIE